MILQKSARFLMIFICAIMFHGNVFGVNDSSCVNGDSHIIGHGMNNDFGDTICSLCVGDRYAILNNGDFSNFSTDYYVCINACSDPTYCIKSEGTGKDCVKMNNDYEKGDNGECVVKDRCASLSPCTAGGCGVDDSTGTCKTCDGYSLFIPADGSVAEHNVCVGNLDNATCENGVCTCNGGYGAKDYIPATTYTTEQPAGCYACKTNQISQNNKCITCEGMKIPNAAKTACVCPAGMVDSNGGCACQTGVINLAGNSCVSECDPGQGYDSNSGKCSVCSDGNYSQPRATTGGRVCVSGCDNGYGAAEDGNCKTCSELGKNTGLNGDCVDFCPRGSKEDENNNCRPCKYFGEVDQNGGCKEKCNMGYVPNANGVCVTCYINNRPDKTKYIDYNSGVFDELVNEGLSAVDCKECPTNFMCNGAKKVKCPFGTTRTGNSIKCTGFTGDNKGFVYAPGDDTTKWEISSETVYLSLNEDQVKDFKYKSCDTLNAFVKTGTIRELAPNCYMKRDMYETELGMQESDWDNNIAICETCGVGHHVYNNECYCGVPNSDSEYGVVKDSLGLGLTETCQICPNGSKTVGNDDRGDYVCKPCADGKAFYLDTDGKFSCKKCLFEGHASYKKDNEDWCLSYDQLTSALNNTDDNSDRYYRKSEKIDNIPVYSWELCPAGYCCYGGKSTPCIRGTFSGEGTVCEGNSLSGVCTACTNGKTTASTGTECNIKNNNQSTNYASVCSNEVCTSDVEATKFCIDRDNKICFDIDKIKMSASGYYNIKYSD